MQNKKIPVFYPHVSSEVFVKLKELLENRWIGQGSKVEEFEDAISKTLGVKHAVAVNSGSAGLRLALSISGVGPGAEVITTAQCCTATNHPILEQYAVPVFADIQYLTGNINPQDIRHRITDKTKAIIAVDLGGYPCDIDELRDIAKAHKLAFIEDASDAIGAEYKKKHIGAISRFTVFSFAAVQLITTGEGGMLCCLEESDMKQARRRRWYGIDRKTRVPNIEGYYDFNVEETGYGYHMTNISAVMGLVHLREMDKILDRKRQIACIYRERLSSVSGIRLFELRDDRLSAHQFFTIHVEKRSDFCKKMRDRQIEVSIVHARNDIYSVFGGRREDLQVLDKYEKTNISLPLHAKLTDDDVGYIIKSISEGW